MRVFKTKWFVRFARKERLADRTLRDAVNRADRGLIDADLGDGVIKQRVARSGQGKSGGYRTIVVYRTKARAIFVYGFAKSGKANLEPDELEGYRKLAKAYLAKSEKEMTAYVEDGALTEVTENEEAD
ncbi:MAG TPA: type II toxin-antitoxin system RelE/ParE family toxin [Hyphomicrobiaceae bacterium]